MTAPDLDEDFTRSVLEGLVPKMESSAMMMFLADGQMDVQFAVQIGLSILMDKPILTLVLPGVEVPEHLRRVSDRVVEIDLADPATQKQLHQEIKSFQEEFAPDAPMGQEGGDEASTDG